MKNRPNLVFIIKTFEFFIALAFVLSVSFAVFFYFLQEALGFMFTEDQLSIAAKATFINMLFLSALFTAIVYVYYYYSTVKPLKRILGFTQDLSSGNFGHKIKERNHGLGSGYDVIISNLNLLSEELASVDGLRSDFINNLSHELKTPLSVMHNYAKLLMYGDLPEETRQKYIGSIYDTTDKMSVLIQNILGLSRLERKKIYKKEDVFSLSDELVDCILAFESKLDEKNILLESDIDEGIVIQSDKSLLTIVCNNLISNAIKFSNPGGVIEIALKKESDKVVITVQDHGIGISSEDIGKIFDKYYQAEGDRKSEGNGIGLAMVKRIADILSLDISVSSRLGEGSVFTVTIFIK